MPIQEDEAMRIVIFDPIKRFFVCELEIGYFGLILAKKMGHLH